MKQSVSRCIVLHRIDYGEKDRILTLLTQDQGKVRVLAKGVRSHKSKLAGGIELFSESTVGLVKSKGDLHVLTSSRLEMHHQNIVKSLDRTMLGYDMLKIVDKLSQDGSGAELYWPLSQALGALDDVELSKELIETWFGVQILHEIGCLPNLQTSPDGQDLRHADMYSFDYDTQCFNPDNRGDFTQNHIKLTRIILSTKSPQVLVQVSDIHEILPAIHRLFRRLIDINLGR